MIESILNYKNKVNSCWMGKAIAGGIGAPFEGVPYSPLIRKEEMHLDTGPNDDLELQLLWLLYIEKYGMELTSADLAEAWINTIGYGFDEYGIAIKNLKKGIIPPYSGYIDNFFQNGLGAAIRTEIWASVFPGRPKIAAYFARIDASVDHYGEGVDAAVFLASLESYAFENGLLLGSIEEGLKYIPESSKIRDVVLFVIKKYNLLLPVEEIQELIIKRYGSHNFTDCVMNMGFIILSLLHGGDSFEDVVLISVNCGYDTDCTAATAGAIWGILYGMEKIPSKWKKQLNGDIEVSDFLQIQGIPLKISELTNRVVSLGGKLDQQAEIFSIPNIEFSLSKAKNPFAVNSWLVFNNIDDNSINSITEEIEDGKIFEENILEDQSIHLEVAQFVDMYNTITLFTFMSVEEDYFNAPVMFSANTHISVYIDGKRKLEYHGRAKHIPSFHRVEGGGLVFMDLMAGEKYLVKIVLKVIQKDSALTVAVGDDRFLHNTNVKFTI